MSMTTPGYEVLADVLQAAYDQSAHGKGAERHAHGNAFEDQRMQTISDLLDSPDGMMYQVIKKMTEGIGFQEHDRREKELLGALVYLAGIVVWYRRQHEGLPTKGYLPEPRPAPAPIMPSPQKDYSDAVRATPPGEHPRPFNSCKFCGAIGGHGELACPWKAAPEPIRPTPSTLNEADRAYQAAMDAHSRDAWNKTPFSGPPRCIVCGFNPCECTGVGQR